MKAETQATVRLLGMYASQRRESSRRIGVLRRDRVSRHLLTPDSDDKAEPLTEPVACGPLLVQ